MNQLSLNERRLVELVASRKSIARVDLAQLSGMTGASITRLTAGLLDSGVFTEETDRKGDFGQPKKMLSITSDRFYSAGLTYSLSEMEIAIVDFSGHVHSSKTLNILGCSTNDIATRAQSAIGEMRLEQDISDANFVGVGCSAPGNFGPSGSSIKAHQLFQDFDNEANVAEFGKAFDAPFFLENDGSAAALGEHVFGRSKDDGDSVFLVHVGYGLGGGAVVDGRLFRGASGNACLPGVLFPYGEPRPTTQDLLDFLEKEGFPVEDINAVTGARGELAGLIDQWLSRAATQLRQVVRVTTGYFDPSVIIVGGRLPTEINDRLVELILSEDIEGPSRGLKAARVRASTLGPKAGAVGAACIPLFRTFFSGAYWDAGSNYVNGRRRQ